MDGAQLRPASQEQRILGGGLPDSARQRLDELLGHEMTSSFFTASAVSVAAEDAIEPLGQLVGASGCRKAIGVVRRTRGPSGRLPIGAPVWREHSGPVQSWTTARERAARRLVEQAKVLKAEAVLGVSARYDEREGDPPAVEVVLTGTAVRIPGLRSKVRSDPILGLLSLQEYALLRRVGVEVVGIAGSCSAVEIGATALTQQAFSRWLSPRGSWELKELTIGVYEARRLAVERLHANAAKLNASGVIGIDLSSSLTGEAPSAAHGHALMVHLLGTAIRANQIKTTDPQAVMRI